VLKINSKGSSVHGYLEQYNVWVDWYNFYVEKHSPVVSLSHNGIPVLQYFDIENINSATSSIVFIDCCTEGLHSIEYFNQYRKDHYYVIFSNGWWDQNKIKLGIEYDLVWYPFFLYDMNNVYYNPYKFAFYLDKAYSDDYPKPFIFVSTTGNTRPERDLLIDSIKANIEYDNFILRYSGVDFKADSKEYDIIEFEVGEFDPYTAVLKKHYHTVSQSVPIDMYNRAYFNLVVETDLDLQDCFFLTEKTIKAIYTGIPFIIVSTPYFLKHLRELGFCTYNDLWDESYDTELDFNKRVDKIVKLCNELQYFDWKGNKDKLALVRYKNFENAHRLNRLADTGFKKFEEIIKRIETS